MCLWVVMRKPQKIFAAFFIIFSTSAFADFSGAWHIEHPKSSVVTNIADEFNIYLMQEGTIVCGFHYGTGRGKSKLDWGWAYEDRPTVTGHVTSSNTAYIVLHSSHSSNPIEALITIQKGELLWIAKNSKAELPPTIPESATLAHATFKGEELRELKNCSAKDT